MEGYFATKMLPLSQIFLGLLGVLSAQQFYMDSLADLRDLIIGRIEQVGSLQKQQTALVGTVVSAASIEEELQINRGVIRLLGTLKRCEKERVEAESILLETMRSVRFLSSKTIDDVYAASAGIFVHFDPVFALPGGEDMVASDRLRHLLVTFFEKHYARMASGDTLKMLSRPISETTPGILMSWVSEWSRFLFLNRLQAAAGAEFARHEEEMRRLTNHRGSNLIRQKSASPVSHSAFLGRGDLPITPILTNKESVFGLIIEEMMQHYKALPLELDMSYPKSMKKLQGKTDFWNDETLQRAAEILIEAKNRHTREQINEFATHCQLYFQRSSRNTLKKQIQQSVSTQERSSVQLREKSPRKKFSPYEKFFQRVKSESKEEGASAVGADKRNSLLLCPKGNQISFESSREIMRKLQREKLRRECQLPEIAPGRVLSTCAAQKNKSSFFEPNYSIVSNYERYDHVIKNPIPTKSYDFKQPSIQRQYQRKSREKKAQSHQNPELLRQQGQQLRRNRKMMLQLLREKNKHAFLDK